MSEGSMLSLLLFFVLCVKTAIENQYFDVVVNTGADIRSTLSAAIYRKSLKLGPGSRKTNTVNCFLSFNLPQSHVILCVLFYIVGRNSELHAT